MDAETIRSEIIAALADVAPEAVVESLDPAKSFRDQIEFDSVDFLEFVLRLERRLQIKIPQADYPKLSSLNGALRYLAALAAEPIDSARTSDQ